MSEVAEQRFLDFHSEKEIKNLSDDEHEVHVLTTTQETVQKETEDC